MTMKLFPQTRFLSVQYPEILWFISSGFVNEGVMGWGAVRALGGRRATLPEFPLFRGRNLGVPMTARDVDVQWWRKIHIHRWLGRRRSCSLHFPDDY